MSALSNNRRRHERLALPPMYAAISARLLKEKRYAREGHAYDISEGGVQFELDAPLTPGTPIALRLFLPASIGGRDASGPVEVFGNVVWCDDSEPGPVRHAAVFSRFASEEDRERLLAAISRNLRSQRAA